MRNRRDGDNIALNTFVANNAKSPTRTKITLAYILFTLGVRSLSHHQCIKLWKQKNSVYDKVSITERLCVSKLR